MQTLLVDKIFQGFLQKFALFFSQTETGFRNELIVQMYSRRHFPEEVVVYHGQRYGSIQFLTRGSIDMFTKDDQEQHFFSLVPGVVYGDYQTIYGMRSNMTLRTTSAREQL